MSEYNADEYLMLGEMDASNDYREGEPFASMGGVEQFNRYIAPAHVPTHAYKDYRAGYMRVVVAHSDGLVVQNYLSELSLDDEEHDYE